MTQLVKFNLNDRVQVKLTDHGRKILWRNHSKLEAELHKDLPFSLPKEDAEGWSRWQLWCLMRTFGPHICMTEENPILLDIQFEVNK